MQGICENCGNVVTFNCPTCKRECCTVCGKPLEEEDVRRGNKA